MPELPEVETIVRELQITLPGKKVLSIEQLYAGTVRYNHTNICSDKIPYCLIRTTYGSDNNESQPLPPLQKSPQGIIETVERRGKYILIRLNGGKAIVIHLRMTGKLILEHHTKENSTKEIQQLRHIRAKLHLSDNYVLLFNDPRTFGKIDVVSSDALLEIDKKLGCEPLTKKLNRKYLASEFARSKVSIKKVLLDQRIIAGIGNIYANEILYRAMINPFKPVCSLTENEIASIIRSVKAVLKKAISCNGTTISDYRRVDDKQGSFQNFLQVYGKTECPKKHKLVRVKSDGRSTFFCPVCQPDKNLLEKE